mmetsp:Transcript_14392/g.22622  ORF Transcript_14392/g.22622 Transcript_14392/m.22622 type:complete len:255 (+) Transcript_14392:42-806(+)
MLRRLSFPVCSVWCWKALLRSSLLAVWLLKSTPGAPSHMTSSHSGMQRSGSRPYRALRSIVQDCRAPSGGTSTTWPPSPPSQLVQLALPIQYCQHRPPIRVTSILGRCGRPWVQSNLCSMTVPATRSPGALCTAVQVVHERAAPAVAPTSSSCVTTPTSRIGRRVWDYSTPRLLPTPASLHFMTIHSRHRHTQRLRRAIDLQIMTLASSRRTPTTRTTTLLQSVLPGPWLIEVCSCRRITMSLASRGSTIRTKE